MSPQMVKKPRLCFEKKDERQFLLEFIRVYKSLEALWNSKCKEYSDRAVKAEQYDILLEKYRERYPGADKQILAKKINSLRTNFRKELNRLKEFAATSSPNDTFETSLWYYEELSFIAENDDNAIRVQRVDYNDYMMHDEMKYSPPKKKIKRQFSDYAEEFIDDPDYDPMTVALHNKNLQNISQQQQQQESSTNSMTSSIPAPASIIEDDRYAADAYSSVLQHQSQHNQYTQLQQNEYQKIGETWAMKLQKMDMQQQIFAEKFISDILFEGLMGTLHRNAVQLNLNVSSHDNDALNDNSIGDDNPVIIEYEPQSKQRHNTTFERKLH